MRFTLVELIALHIWLWILYTKSSNAIKLWWILLFFIIFLNKLIFSFRFKKIIFLIKPRKHHNSTALCTLLKIRKLENGIRLDDLFLIMIYFKQTSPKKQKKSGERLQICFRLPYLNTLKSHFLRRTAKECRFYKAKSTLMRK